MTFAIRGDIMGALGRDFTLSNEDIGWIAGTAFWGFTLSIFFGGQIVDNIGMGVS
jgi:MFS family permease